MERYSTRHIDEVNRITLPIEIRKRLVLETDSIVILQPIGNIVVVQKKNEKKIKYFHSKVNQLGKIEFSDELMRNMNWKHEDGIAIYHVDDGMVILKRV